MSEVTIPALCSRWAYGTDPVRTEPIVPLRLGEMQPPAAVVIWLSTGLISLDFICRKREEVAK